MKDAYTYDRLFVKMVRDKTRKHLSKTGICFVTGSANNVEIHHMYTMSALVNDYLKHKKIKVTDANKLEVRAAFIEENREELQEQVVLTKMVHKKLHVIFGNTYPNHIVPKVRLWLERQKEKHGQLDN